jgi:hypothetical protein
MAKKKSTRDRGMKATITVAMTPALKKLLLEAAQREDVLPSDIVRKTLRLYLQPEHKSVA